MKFIFIGIFLLSVNALAAITEIYTIKKNGTEEIGQGEVEARVKLSYDISKLGISINIKVIESTDEKFNKKAMTTLERLIVEPKELNGIIIIQKNNIIEIIFYEYSENANESLK